MISDKFKAIPCLYFSSVILMLVTTYIIIKFGYHCHWDEWTGRGLYPGIAMANGIDIHDLKTSPLITGYGAGMALFYTPAAIANNPITSIWIAYTLNISAILFVFLKVKSSIRHKGKTSLLLLYLLLIILFLLSATDPTLHYIFKIHADLPALFFLIYSIILYKSMLSKNRFQITWFIGFLWALSFWSKITILPSLFLFLIMPLLNRQLKVTLINSVVIFISGFTIFCILGLLYDFDDILFFTFQSSGTFGWADRDMSLMIGNGKIVSNLSDKIITLLKIVGLYSSDYWHYLIAAFALICLAIRNKTYHSQVFPLTYFLLLPGCLAALAKWGGIANSLIFCNFMALAIVFELVFLFYKNNSKIKKVFFLTTLTLVCLVLAISPIRLAKSISTNLEESPNNQAFRYLEDGNEEIYFGWYPISHYFSEGKFYSSLSLPTYMAISTPEKCYFNEGHLPKNSKYVALLKKAPYGGTAIKKYIGDIEKTEDIEALSLWSIFRIKDR